MVVAVHQSVAPDMLQTYVSSVSGVSYMHECFIGCCKTKSGSYICCNGYTRILQAYVPNVLAVSDVYCTYFI
jgi:hypothetical protein